MKLSKGLQILVCVLAFSCGRDGRDGSDAPKPEDKPNPDEIAQTIECEMKWELSGEPAGRYYDLSYTVLKLKNKKSHVTLSSTYHTAKAKQESDVLVLKNDSDEDAAVAISTPLWLASLSGKSASFRNLPLNEARSVSCD